MKDLKVILNGLEEKSGEILKYIEGSGDKIVNKPIKFIKKYKKTLLLVTVAYLILSYLFSED